MSNPVRQFGFHCGFYYENENLCCLLIEKSQQKHLSFYCGENKMEKNRDINLAFFFFNKAYLKIDGFVVKLFFFVEQARYWATFTV